jgi:hypothetical protein
MSSLISSKQGPSKIMQKIIPHVGNLQRLDLFPQKKEKRNKETYKGLFIFYI